MFSNKLVAQLNTRSFNFFVPYTPLKHNYRVFISPFLEYGAQKFVSRRTNRTFYSARSIRMAREVGRKRINIRSFRRNRNKPIPLIFAFSRLMCQKFSLSLSLSRHAPVNYVRSISFLTLSTRKFSRHFEIMNRDPRAERAPNVASDAFLFSPFPSSPTGSSISAKRTFMDIQNRIFFFLFLFSSVLFPKVSLLQFHRSSSIDSKWIEKKKRVDCLREIIISCCVVRNFLFFKISKQKDGKM